MVTSLTTDGPNTAERAASFIRALFVATVKREPTAAEEAKMLAAGRRYVNGERIAGRPDGQQWYWLYLDETKRA